jgi:hypothetical protein
VVASLAPATCGERLPTPRPTTEPANVKRLRAAPPPIVVATRRPSPRIKRKKKIDDSGTK